MSIHSLSGKTIQELQDMLAASDAEIQLTRDKLKVLHEENDNLYVALSRLQDRALAARDANVTTQQEDTAAPAAKKRKKEQHGSRNVRVITELQNTQGADIASMAGVEDIQATVTRQKTDVTSRNEIVCSGNGIELVDAGSYRVTDIDAFVEYVSLSPTSKLQHIKSLDMRHLFNAKTIDWIVHCSVLEKFKIWDCLQISDLSVIGALTNLRELDMCGSRTKTIDWIVHCSVLEKLNISCSQEIADFSVIAALPNLYELDMSETHAENIDWIVQCSALEKLNVGYCRGISDFSVIAALPNLHELNLSGNKAENIDWIVHCSSLETLSLHGCRGIIDYGVLGRLKCVLFMGC